IRRSVTWTFFISIIVNIGMWFERFVIIVTSLHRDYLPSSWAMFSPTMFDIGDYIFSFGFFFTFFLLFSKYLPVINRAAVKGVLRSSSERLTAKISGVAKADRVSSPSYNKDIQ